MPCLVCWKSDVEEIAEIHSRIRIQFRRSLRGIVLERATEYYLVVCEVEKTDFHSW